MTRTTTCSLIVFAGAERTADFMEHGFAHLLGVMQAHGAAPTHVALDGPGFPDTILPAENALKKVRSRGTVHLRSATFHHGHPNAEWPAWDWTRTAGVALNDLSGAECYLCMEQSGHEEALTRAHLAAMASLAAFEYGFIHTLPRDQCPDLYAIVGVGEGITDALRLELEHWFAFLMAKEPLGARVRDLYATNFLNPLQLDAPVGQSTLRELLRAHGASFSPFTPTLTTVTIPHHRIADVRERTRGTGVLIALDGV